MKRRRICLLCLVVFIIAVCLSACSGSSSKTIRSSDDINSSDFKLGVANGARSHLVAEELFPNASIQIYSSIPEGCTAVKTGKLDGFIFDKVVMEECCKQNPDLTCMDETFEGGSYSIGIAKGNEDLLEKVNAAIKKLSDDGTLDDMKVRWLDGEDRTMPKLEAPDNPTGTLRILTEGLTEPFEYISEDNTCIGYDVELGIRIAYELGMNYSVQTMGFGSLIPALTSGKGDVIISALSITEERKKEMLFSDVYLQNDAAIVVRKDRYQSLADKTFTLTDSEISQQLSNSKIGVLSGSLSEQLVREEFTDSEILDFPALPDAVAALSAGKIDYALVSEAQAMLLVNQQDGYQYCTEPYHVDHDSFALSKDDTELCDAINEVIAKFHEDGTLKAVYNKWAYGDYSTEDIPKCTDGPVLTVAMCATIEPLGFIYNGEVAGFDAEIIERIAYELGMQVEFQDMAFSATLSAVASGKADITTSLVNTEERAEQLLFTDVYYDENIVMLRAVEGAVSSDSWIEKLKDGFVGTFVTEGRWKLFIEGICVTALISVLAYVLGTIVGLGLCLMLCSKKTLCRKASSAYIKIVTGIPILVWLMILYYIVFRGVDISGIAVAIIGFGLETGASLAGVFKTGYDAVDKGQIEAAAALGFMPSAIFRRIVFPQAAQRIFDLYQGEFVSLLKATSIVGYIAITDLTKVSDIVRSRTYQAFFPLITTALIYFGMICIFIALIKPLQRKLNPKMRKNILKGLNLKA